LDSGSKRIDLAGSGRPPGKLRFSAVLGNHLRGHGGPVGLPLRPEIPDDAEGCGDSRASALPLEDGLHDLLHGEVDRDDGEGPWGEFLSPPPESDPKDVLCNSCEHDVVLLEPGKK